MFENEIDLYKNLNKPKMYMQLKARRGFAFVTESWVRKFDGQLSVCAPITYDVMDSVGAKEITSFAVESWGCKTQCLGVFLGESVNLAAP